MYSRTPHSSYGNAMSRREPSYRRMNGIPPNYSGIAFGYGDAQPDGDLPRRPEDDTTPRFDGLPQVSRLPEPLSAPLPEEAVKAATGEPSKADESRSAGLFSLFDHFGKGIGYEELLLIGLIFFLMKECDGEGDFKETVILLGLLLLGG